MQLDVTLRPSFFRRLWAVPVRSLRGKILLAQGLVAAMLLVTAGATILAVERIDHQPDHGHVADEQMETVLQVASHLNRHSENVADLLVLSLPLKT